MRYFKLVLLILLFILVLLGQTSAVSPSVRIKDIAHVLEARENQVMGFGLVVGLKRTGDSGQTGFTKQALTNLLSRMGIPPQTGDFRSRNVAAVIVTANLPPFIKPGQKLDVIVSSVGDAASLKGGTLLLTPLYGADEEVYAVAQGPVSIGGIESKHYAGAKERAAPTVGRIPNGALVEKEVPVSIGAIKNHVILIIDNPDFTTASRIAESISRSGLDAKVNDAATVIVPFFKGEDPIELIAKIENLAVVPDTIARIIIDERTGTIVIGENVRLAPVAVSYQGFSVTVGDVDVTSLATTMGEEEEAELTLRSSAKLKGREGELRVIGPGGNIRDVVKALNALGATPKDLIAILQAIKASGALSAELEII